LAVVRFACVPSSAFGSQLGPVGPTMVFVVFLLTGTGWMVGMGGSNPHLMSGESLLPPRPHPATTDLTRPGFLLGGWGDSDSVRMEPKWTR